MTFMVGFDLDMTLVDSRDGITFTMEQVLGELDISVARDEIFQTIGIPLWDSFAMWMRPDQVDDAVARYRDIYRTVGIPITTVMPGARESIKAIQERGGRTMVVSAKLERAVRAIVDLLDLGVDVVRGDLFAEAKAVALREEHADVYVGDHLGDVRGAKAAGAVSVAVATGPTTAGELQAAGADIVLADLTSFPEWLDSWLARRS